MTKPSVFRIIATLLFMGLSFHQMALAGHLGSYKETDNLAGFIDLNPDSPIYQGLEEEEKDDGVNRQTPSQIVKALMNKGAIDGKKLKDLAQKVWQMEYQAMLVHCQKEMIKGSRTNAWCLEKDNYNKIRKDWKKEEMSKAYNYARFYFNQALKTSSGVTSSNINSNQSRPFLKNLFEALEVYQMLRGEDDVIGHLAGVRAMGSKLYHFVLEKPVIKANRLHAANLLKPSGSDHLFYSYQELEKLKKEGADLSLLNPPDSAFWRAPKGPISKADLNGYAGEDVEALKGVLKEKEIEDLLNPDEVISVEMTKSLPRGGASPKINVHYGKAKFKMKFITHKQGASASGDLYDDQARFFQNSEMDAELVVNKLAAMLGFSVEPTYFKKTVRLYLPKKYYQNPGFEAAYKKLLGDVKNRFENSWNATSAFQVVKKDKKGKPYIEMRQVHLEIRSDEAVDFNIGSFMRQGLGKSLKREHRGFALFLAWIMDTGPKTENTKGKLIPTKMDNGKTVYKLALVNADMGASLGLNYPNLYNFNLVKKVKRDDEGRAQEIELNYRRAFALPTLKAINIDDARWMARLIGQISYEQVKSIFFASGYPALVSDYYAQLMMKKRNQLLEALDLLGQENPNALGEITILNKEKEFTGSIEGSEEFFKDGLLNDPSNRLHDPKVEPFARYWGSDFKHYGGDPNFSVWDLFYQKAFRSVLSTAHSYLLEDVSLTNLGPTLFPVNTSSFHALENSACDGNCFMQGVQFGVSSFIPMRYLIPNPLKDPNSKYWWVDVFRVGAFIGHNGEGLLNAIGLEGATTLGLGVSAKFYKVGEYIKIHPIKDEKELLGSLKDLYKITKMPFKGARESFVRSMKKGEVLVQSSYIGKSASIALKPLSSIMPLNVGPSIRLTGDHVTAQRITLLKNDDKNILVNWSKLKQASATARLNLIDFFIQIPLLEMQLRKVAEVDNTYRFDMTKRLERQVLFDNLKAEVPNSIPAPLRLEWRGSDAVSGRFSFGLFGLLGKKRYTKKVESKYVNFKDYTSGTDWTYEKKHVSKKINSLNFVVAEDRISASVNSKHGMFAKVSLSHSFPAATREDFLDIYDRYRLILPENFITFDPKQVVYYVGDFDLKIETIFSEEGLAQIFDPRWSQYGMCLRYAKLHHFEDPAYECRKMEKNPKLIYKAFKDKKKFEQTSDADDFEDLYEEYHEARQKYWRFKAMKPNWKSKSYKKYAYKMLKEVVDMLGDSKYFKYQTMKFFITMVSKNNFYRKAHMKAKTEAFPGHEDEIEENEYARGNLEPTLRQLAPSGTRAFEIFSDRIHNVIAPYMLNYKTEL